MRRILKYIENFWIGDDGKPSIRRVISIFFSIDLLRNFYKAGDAVNKILNLISADKVLDATVLNATAGFLANTAMIIGIEAGLVAALFSLTTYQNIQLNKGDGALNSGGVGCNQPPGNLPE